MRPIAQSLAKQPFGGIGISEGRQQEIDRGARRIDGPIQITPAAFDLKVGLIHTPRFVGGLEMPPHPLFQFRAIALHPTPHRRVIGFQAALLQEHFDIAQRQRVSKVPTNGTKNECGFGLPPFEDRWSGCHRSFQPTSTRRREVATLPGLEHSPDIPEFSYHELREDTVPFRVVLAHGAGAAAASRVRSQRMAVRHLLRPSDALLRNIRYLVRKARRQYFEIHWRNSLCLILTSLKQADKGIFGRLVNACSTPTSLPTYWQLPTGCWWHSRCLRHCLQR